MKRLIVTLACAFLSLSAVAEGMRFSDTSSPSEDTSLRFENRSIGSTSTQKIYVVQVAASQMTIIRSLQLSPPVEGLRISLTPPTRVDSGGIHPDPACASGTLLRYPNVCTIDLLYKPTTALAAQTELIINGVNTSGMTSIRRKILLSSSEPTLGNPYLVNQMPTFTPRDYGSLLSLNGGLYVLGGNLVTSGSSDVWYSGNNGTTWESKTATAAYGKVPDAKGLVFNDALYVFSFGNPGGINDGVFRSADGANWQKINKTEIHYLSGYCTVAHAGKMYIIGGDPGNSQPFLNSVYESYDGVDWVRTPQTQFQGRTGLKCASFNGKLYVIGGQGQGGNRLRDVWSSVDGRSFVQESAAYTTNPAAYESFGAVVASRKLFVIGNGVVSQSSDGKNWLEVENRGLGTTGATGSVTAHTDGVYLLVPRAINTPTSYAVTNEIWKSSFPRN